jgi:hypothetical protein
MMTVFPTPGSWSLKIIYNRINTSYLYAIKRVLQKQQLKRYMYEKEVIVKQYRYKNKVITYKYL